MAGRGQTLTEDTDDQKRDASSYDSEIEAIVRLLPVSPRKTFQERYSVAEAQIGRHFETDSSFLLKLIKAAVEADLNDTPLIEDTVSFLDPQDLVRLSFLLLDFAKRGRNVESLVGKVALQEPQLFPESLVREQYDFRDWWTHADPLRPPPCEHIIFENGPPSGPPVIARQKHPTWHLPTTRTEFRMGGEGSATCPTCRQTLAHLITLENVPAGTGFQLPQLRLETCPNSLGPAFYSHDAGGRPTPIEPPHPEGFDGAIVPLREIMVRLARTPDRWLRQSWGHSNSRENLFRVGGLPSWIQSPEIPCVPGTDREMEFLLQVDSELQDVQGSHVLWGSGGLLYVFWDSQTRISCHLPQFT
jgi:hypothetical protein